MTDRHADLADLAAGTRVVGVVAQLGRQVEGDGQAGLAARQVVAEQFVGGRRGGVARVGPEQPRPVALRRGRRGPAAADPGQRPLTT